MGIMGSVVLRRKEKPNDRRLPRDILHEVLLRLPPDALCRARLVCRSWRSLTSDLSFTEAYSSRYHLVAALHAEWGEVHIADLSGNIIRRILIDGVSRSGFNVSTQLDAICVSRVFKPSIVLRSSSTGRVTTTLTEPEFVASPSASPLLLVLVPSTREYKVLRFGCSSHDGSSQRSYVTTINGGGGGGGSRSWRMGSRLVDLEVPAVQTGSFRYRAVIDGVAYFLVDMCNERSAGMELDSVVSFDLEREEWKRPPIRGPLSSLLGRRRQAWVQQQQ